MISSLDCTDDSRCGTQRSYGSTQFSSQKLVLQAAESLIRSMESMQDGSAPRGHLLMCPPLSKPNTSSQTRTMSHETVFPKDTAFIPTLDLSKASQIGRSNRTSMDGSRTSSPHDSTRRQNLRQIQNCYKAAESIESKKSKSNLISSSSAGCSDSEGLLSVSERQHILCEIEKLCRHVLPSFDFSKAGLGVSSQTPACSNFYKSALQRLSLLRMTMDAKTETMTVIRAKMKEELDCMRANVEQAHMEQSRQSTKSREIEALRERDVACMSTQLEQERQAHEHQLAAIANQIRSSEDAQQELKGQLAESDESVKQLKEAASSQNTEIQQLHSEINQHKELQSSLATENSHLKDIIETITSELEQTRLAQKFLGDGLQAGSRVKDTELVLMRKCDALLSEMTKLKKANFELSEQLKQTSKQHMAALSDHRLSDLAVKMVCADKVSDDQLTEKILRRHMSAASSVHSSVCGVVAPEAQSIHVRPPDQSAAMPGPFTSGRPQPAKCSQATRANLGPSSPSHAPPTPTLDPSLGGSLVLGGDDQFLERLKQRFGGLH